MKSQISWVAAILIALGVGIVIGRKMQSRHNGSDSVAQEHDGTAPSDYRSSRLSRASESSRHNGGSTGAKVGNKIKHMSRMAEQLNMERGMPDFDALFGIWETARSMSPEEIRHALEEIKSLQLPRQSQMFMNAMLVMQWAKKDGPAAMEFASQSKTNRSFVPIKEMALQAWASSDADGAYAWYESHKESMNPREQKQFEAQAIAALAKDNFELAFQKAKMVASSSREKVLQSLGAVVATNPEQRAQLVEYLKTLDNKETRTQTGRAIARQLAATDTKEAIRFVNEWPGEDQSQLSRVVAVQWGQTEPEKAIAWQFEQLPEGGDRTAAADNIFADWARRTPDEAKNWLERQQDVDQDQLRSEAIGRMRWDDNYQLSISWADEIQDEKKRLNNYKSIYSSWQQDDKEGAQRWLEAQPKDFQDSIHGISREATESIAPSDPSHTTE